MDKWIAMTGFVRIALALAAGIACLMGKGEIAVAQNLPDPPMSVSGWPPQLPPPPAKLPRPPEGPESVKSFVENLSTKDSAFEVIVGQGRIMTLKKDLAIVGKREPVIAIGDPAVIDVTVLNSRQLRIVAQRIGVTDLSIITAKDETYNFEVRVVADLHVLRARLQQIFPDARLRLAQIRDHIIVEGQARDTRQVARIMNLINAYLISVTASEGRQVTGRASVQLQPGAGQAPAAPAAPQPPGAQPLPGTQPPATALPEIGGPVPVQATIVPFQVINLIRVPGSQQVLLKVRVAELNRTALRRIGADLAIANSHNGSVGGTQIGGGTMSATGIISALGGLVTNTGKTAFSTSGNTTAFGIFEKNFEVLLQALRQNSMLKILAEPNLVTMHGQPASFLAGGQFPVPVPQAVTGGAGTTVTVRFKNFGVQLNFVPYIEDGETIRLSVAPSVSTIDFTLGTTLVPGGSPVPGLNVRAAQTTVELKEGQTLGIAGLLQVSLDAQTNRLPVLGDIPILGPFFLNSSNTRTEKELLILVTPYLVEPMNCDQIPPSPGMEVHEPDDWEFYLHHRIESHEQNFFRSTTRQYTPPQYLLNCYFRLEQRYFQGPCGFCP